MAGKIVLYVEDELDDLILMDMAFEKAGMKDSLRAVHNGREAMNYLKGIGNFGDRDRYPLPDLLLLDWSLPVVAGVEVLEAVRRDPQLANLPVIVFTSLVRPDQKRQAMARGANGYLQKPGSPRELGQLVEKLKPWLEAPGP